MFSELQHVRERRRLAHAKSTLSQHFKVLREAGLIRSERKGVELQNRTRCEDLQKSKPMLLEILAAYRAECRAGSNDVAWASKSAA